MDFITQNLLGGIVGQAAFSRALGRKALWPAMLGGALPDFDFLLKGLADPALPYEWHRFVTHAFVLVPPLGALAALPFFALRSYRTAWRATLGAALLGCATHAVLDTFTSYGTHIWWPFVSGRSAWDSMSIIDPIYSGVLLLGVLGTLIVGRGKPALVAFLLSLVYLTFGISQHDRAARAQAELAAQRGHEIEAGRVLPSLGNVILFRSVYRTADGMIHADAIRVGLFRDPLVRDGASAARVTLDDLPATADDARTRDVIERFSRFADGYMTMTQLDATTYLVADDRLSLDPAAFAPLWGVRISTVDPDPVSWSDGHRRNLDRAALLDELTAPDDRYRVLIPPAR